MTTEDARASTIVVPSTTLGRLWAKLGGVPYSLVADIEGAEFDLPTHGMQALRRCQTAIVELHGGQSSCEQFVREMRGCDLHAVSRNHDVCVFQRVASFAVAA